MNSLIFNNIVKLLLRHDYMPVGESYDGEKTIDSHIHAGFAKKDGSILSYIFLINTESFNDKAEEYITAYGKKCCSISQQNNIRHTLCVYVFIGSQNQLEASSFYNNSKVFDIESGFTEVYWAVNTDSNELIPAKGMPDKINGIEKLIMQGISYNETQKIYSEYVSEEITAMKKTPFITIGLLAINLFIFLIMTLDGGSTDTATLIAYGANEPNRIIIYGEYYRLFTSMFLHIGLGHLIANSFSLYIIGTRIEKRLSTLGYLFIYIFSGICCSIFSILFSNTVSAGASGAICGLFATTLLYIILKKRNMASFDFYSIMLIIIFNVAYGLMLPNIDNWGHLGGFIGGIISAAIYFAIEKRNKNAK